MLPSDLHGPGSIDNDEGRRFLDTAFLSYPDVHRDFISQICCEHPERMDDYFPDFDIDKHTVVERSVSAEWIAENVRYDGNEKLDSGRFHGEHFDRFYPKEAPYFVVYNSMIKAMTWPFPPVIVEHVFAMRELGGIESLGRPYHLFEGTHRVSYLLKMIEMGLIAYDTQHYVLELTGAA